MRARTIGDCEEYNKKKVVGRLIEWQPRPQRPCLTLWRPGGDQLVVLDSRHPHSHSHRNRV